MCKCPLGGLSVGHCAAVCFPIKRALAHTLPVSAVSTHTYRSAAGCGWTQLQGSLWTGTQAAVTRHVDLTVRSPRHTPRAGVQQTFTHGVAQCRVRTGCSWGRQVSAQAGCGAVCVENHHSTGTQHGQGEAGIRVGCTVQGWGGPIRGVNVGSLMCSTRAQFAEEGLFTEFESIPQNTVQLERKVPLEKHRRHRLRQVVKMHIGNGHFDKDVTGLRTRWEYRVHADFLLSVCTVSGKQTIGNCLSHGSGKKILCNGLAPFPEA
ncbi:hypothetical protein H8959_013313 [Pygathrix nigripes]